MILQPQGFQKNLHQKTQQVLAKFPTGHPIEKRQTPRVTNSKSMRETPRFLEQLPNQKPVLLQDLRPKLCLKGEESLTFRFHDPIKKSKTKNVELQLNDTSVAPVAFIFIFYSPLYGLDCCTLRLLVTFTAPKTRQWFEQTSQHQSNAWNKQTGGRFHTSLVSCLSR